MFVRVVTVATTLLVAWPALAEPLDVDAARRFVVGKTFAYNCFDGTRGAGRIQSDLSVAGTIQIRGNGPIRFVQLPPGTLKVKGEAVCASVRGIPFEPCFNVDRTDRAELPRLGRRACRSPIAISPAAVRARRRRCARRIGPRSRWRSRRPRRRPATDNAPIRAHPLGAAPISGAVAFRAGNSRRW